MSFILIELHITATRNTGIRIWSLRRAPGSRLNPTVFYFRVSKHLCKAMYVNRLRRRAGSPEDAAGHVRLRDRSLIWFLSPPRGSYAVVLYWLSSNTSRRPPPSPKMKSGKRTRSGQRADARMPLASHQGDPDESSKWFLPPSSPISSDIDEELDHLAVGQYDEDNDKDGEDLFNEDTMSRYAFTTPRTSCPPLSGDTHTRPHAESKTFPTLTL